MSQVIFANQKPPTNTDGFYAQWALTRALLAAGWKYKGSGDATPGGTKDASSNFLNEKWGVGGGVQLNTTVQNGTSPAITANTDGTATVVASGFTANSVGRFLVLAGNTNTAGETNLGNNGTFRIVTFTSATTIKIWNPGAVTETTAAATWAEKEGAANGTIATAGGPGTSPGRALFSVAAGTPFVAPTSSSRGSVGDKITIAGGAVGANNGTFTITKVVSTTQVEIDNSAATATGETNNGSLIWTECSPTAQTYPTSQVPISSSTNVSPIVITTTINHNYVTGDVVAIQNHTVNTNANGRWNIIVVTATTFQLAGSTGNGVGGATGTATDLTTPTGMLLGAWENLQGPSTLKIPIGTNTPSAAFYRGEKVTQTTSGATGTILGVIMDTVGGLGFLVVEPRLNGTGGGVRGWTSGSADTVSAAAAPGGSGASVTSSSTAPIEYVREMVIWKNSISNGHMWVQCVDQSGESTSRYSNAASSTNTICPGGATGTFPTLGSYVVFGTGASNAASTGSSNWHNTALTNYGAVHVLCATCIETSTESADGSWTLLQGIPNSSADAYMPTAYMHMDSSEEGDLDPYVSFTPSGQAAYAATRTALTTTNSGAAAPFMHASAQCVNANTQGRGWRRRGFASADAYQDFGLGFLFNGTTGPVLQPTTPTFTATRVSNHPNPNMQIREPLWVVSTGPAAGPTKMRKGYFRWWFITEGGTTNKLLFNGAYIQIDDGTSAGPFVAGPWDGTTIPLNGL